MRKLCVAVLLCIFALDPDMAGPQDSAAIPSGPFVAEMDMNMMILPGTLSYLQSTIAAASQDGATMIVVRLDTPGGMLETSQQMIQTIFSSPIPIAIYVSPTGATATSAGVFITVAGHIAAMAPGTSIGAAHPVSGDGKDIQGDMRQKAENMTVAMVRSIADRRGRNTGWVEKAVKESISSTATEALEQKVIDVVADDVNDLLRKIAGKEVRLESGIKKLGDYSKLPRRSYPMSYQDRAINVLANPNVAALLWLAATTGISLELYNPGAILPGVVGVICLVLALAVSQIIPLSQGAILLIVIGALLIGAELFTGSVVLGVGGVLSMVFGALYLVDTSAAPGMAVAVELVLPAALVLGCFLFWVAFETARSMRRKKGRTGKEGLIGLKGRAVEAIAPTGRVFLNGEYWNAFTREGVIEKEAEIEVVSVEAGLKLAVRKTK